MDMHHFKFLVDQAKALGAKTISVFGYGEPYFEPLFEEKIAYCTSLELDTFTTSNASLITEERAIKTLDAGLSHIRFSVHGLRDTYEMVHKPLKWDVVMSNIDRFIRLNNERDWQCQVSISVIPMHGESIDLLRTFWEPHVDYLEVWKPHNWIDGRKYRKIKDKNRKVTCGRPHNGPIQILASGKMVVCCWDYNGQMVVGDTYINTIEEILKCEKFDHIRHCHKIGKVDGLLCANCDQLQDEDESPLLYSSRDTTREVGKTSSTKFKLKEM
jgi:MoaA/NifB/PqqE/SkfB family radical SAM enzyme